EMRCVATLPFDGGGSELSRRELGDPAEQVGPRPVDAEQAWRGGPGEMDTEQVVGVLVAELRREERAPIPSMGAEPVVAEDVTHEPDPEVGRLPEVHAGLRERGREAEARQRRYDDVERVVG